MNFRNNLLSLVVLILTSNLSNAQDLYPINYFPVWDMPTSQFENATNNLIGINLYESYLENKVFNIHLEYVFKVERISEVAMTPSGSTFNGKIVLPIWFKVQDVDGASDKFLKPDMVISPSTDDITPDCGIVEATWVEHEYLGQTSLNTAIVTESDNMLMFASSEISSVIESSITIDIQTPINVVENPEGIYLFNDYYGNWNSNLNAGNWFAVKDINGDFHPIDSYEGYKIEIEYVDISVSIVEDDIYVNDYLSLQEFVDSTICESQIIELNFPTGSFLEYNSFSWMLDGEILSNDSTLIAEQPGDYSLYLYGCDTISGGFELSNYDVELANIYDKYICPGDSQQIDFPSGDYSMYESFLWIHNGLLFSNDSSIVITENGIYNLELYGCDTLVEVFELYYFESNDGDSILADITLCEGEIIEVEFPTNISPGYTSSNWYHNNELYSSSNSLISISDSGEYTLELYGCDTVQDSFIVNVIENNTSELSFNDTILCEGEILSVEFPSGDFTTYDSFAWKFNGLDFSYDSTLVIEEQGLYSLSFYGCPNRIEEFEVEFHEGYINGFNDTIICVGETIDINFPSGNHNHYESFIWFLNGEQFSLDSTISIYQSGVYSLELYGCDTISEFFDLTFFDLSIDSLAFADTTICNGEELSVNYPVGVFAGYFDFTWYLNDIFYSSDSNIIINEEGSYTFELYGCDTISDEFYLTVNDNNTDVFSFPDTFICVGDTVLIDFPEGDFSNYISLEWFHNDEFYSSDSSIYIFDSGEYSLHLNGCPYLVDYFFVTFYEYPLLMSDSELNVDSVIYICLEDDPVLITPFEDYLHTWYLDGIPLDTNQTDRTLILESIIDNINLNEIYSYYVDIEFECGVVGANNSVEIAVIECECGLDMPNIFTPNGDNVNDYFKPFNNFDGEFVDPEMLCQSTDFHMEIFNQWGRNVSTISSNDQFPRWDGLNSSGNKLRDGVYFYRITYKVNIYSLPEQKEISGYFHMLN